MSEVTAAGGAGSPVTADERADELPAIVKKCGFNWPDDEAGRWRVLGLVAGTVAYWRKQCDECLSGVMRESRYQHLERRLLAYIRKCRNIRKAAIEYKAGRDFDQFAALRTENERLTAAIRAAEADAAARERELCAQICDTVYREYGEAVRTCDTPTGHELLKNCARAAGICAESIRARGTAP
jgi:hypothetical protein